MCVAISMGVGSHIPEGRGEPAQQMYLQTLRARSYKCGLELGTHNISLQHRHHRVRMCSTHIAGWEWNLLLDAGGKGVGCCMDWLLAC